jgi:hypothetical protein
MRFSFFRDRLCIEPTAAFSGMFNPSNGQITAFDNKPKPDTASTEPPKFSAAELKEKLGITEDAAKLLTDGGKLRLTEQEVLERLQSPENKTYDVSRKSHSKLDSFENFNNAALLTKIDRLDGKSGDLRITKEGDIAWGAAGAVEPQTPSSTERREAGFAGPEFNPPNKEMLEADAKTIQSALEKTGGDKNQKIQYQGVLLTDNSDMGSSNVRFYSVGEGDNAKYVGIKQGNAQILSQKELEAHLTKLNETRTAAKKPELDIGKFDEIKPDQYLDVPPKTEA